MTRTGRAGAVAVLLAGLLAVGLLTLAAATRPADAAGRFRVVTRTFSDPQPIAINDLSQATPYPSGIGVGGAFGRGRVQDVDLTLKNFTHGFEEDVDVMLAKAATNRTVMSDVAAEGPTADVTLKLDDEAANTFPVEPSALTDGTYRPANLGGPDAFPFPAPAPGGASALGGFDGARVKGTWKLYMVDDLDVGGGQIAGGWSLKIKAKVRR